MNELGLAKEYFTLSESGELLFDSVSIDEIANTFGTPLYVLSKRKILENIKEFKEALSKYFKDSMLLYASKAFSIKEIYRILQESSVGADVVSMGEIETAISTDFRKDYLFFHGNSKSNLDLSYAISNGIHIVVDNESEYNSIKDISKELKTVAKVLFRIKPEVTPHTHAYITTGHLESKFGIDFKTASILIEDALRSENIDFEGVHYHIGSQIFDLDAFKIAAQNIAKFLDSLKEKFGLLPKILDVGGGIGIRYVEEDPVIEKEKFVEAIFSGLLSVLKLEDINSMKVILEPGRAIVGDAGIILYRVVRMKEVSNKKYVFVDGGMGDNIRPALYGAKYTVINTAVKRLPKEKYSIFGKYCESSDFVATDVFLNEVKEGDILAVLSAGAYTYSMASNYNRFERPAVVMIENGKPKLVVKRETVEDIIRLDL